MKTPTITTLDLPAIEAVLDMSGGYVLGFTNRTFAMFFADLGIDIDAQQPDGSKANRLRSFLRSAEPTVAGMVLKALLEWRGEREGDESSTHLAKYNNLIARLGGGTVALPAIDVHVEVLSLAYVHELEKKSDRRLAASDLEGAITLARTMLEAVLHELQRRLSGLEPDDKGDLPRLFKAVAKQLRIDDERTDLDENFKQVVRGLVQVVHGLAPIRNKMSDGHPRQSKPAPHHARAIVNAAKTVTGLLVESYLIQRERGLLTLRSSSDCLPLTITREDS